MIVDDVSWGEELFGPAVSQINDEQVYLMTGHPSTNVFEILELDSVRRLPAQTLEVTAAMVGDQPETHVMPADPRERRETTVPIAADAPELDGRLDDWAGADWLVVDRRLDIRATLRVAGDTLYAAWRTTDPNLLDNDAADGWRFAFASGGGLDLMLRTNPAADVPNRLKHYAHHETATEGDLRLFVTRVGDPVEGRVLAVRFQQVGGPGEAVSYTSPVGRVDFDSVRDVSGRVRLAQQGGVYELAVPLKLLNVKPTDGATTLGDIGVVIGDGSEARARLYWNNKAANMTADIPTEARLLPHEWGTLRFEAR